MAYHGPFGGRGCQGAWWRAAAVNRRGGRVVKSMRHEIGWIATLCGIGSAIGYTAANICLRSVTHLDPIWVSAIKALPTVFFFAPAMASRVLRGQTVFPSLRIVLMAIGAAIVGQLFGNVSFQWALGIVGIALAVPLTLGTMIVSGALLGRFLLGDRVTERMMVASVILIVAICVLSFGASEAHASLRPEESGDLVRVVFGVLAACLSGIAYSVLSVMLRYASNRGTPLSSLLFTVGLTGAVVLGSISFAQHGVDLVVETVARDWQRLIGAGLFNLAAFWMLTKSLHLSSVVFVNVLNASQTAMAAIAGLLLFDEPLTPPVAAGIGLTIVGLLIMRPRPSLGGAGQGDTLGNQDVASVHDEPASIRK